ncbi:MAG: hypothetical protein ABUT20_58385, partial [Bacteroidota bacterium]
MQLFYQKLFSKPKLNFCVMACVLCMFIEAYTTAQVNTGGTSTTANHQKQIIGYITNWDPWKSTANGVPNAGALTHL